MSDLYLEAHITIAPVFDAEREQAARLAKIHGFKLAHLVMMKGPLKDFGEGRLQLSKRDTFMTGHSKNIDDLSQRTESMVRLLRNCGFKVWRYKIESCVLDSRQQGDIWQVLDKDAPALPLIACDSCLRP